MTETTDLSNFASKANAVYNCVTSNATAVTAFSVAGNVCACVVCGPTVCATTSVCSPVICATSCVSAASICATNLYGNGAGLTGLSAGVITVCSGAVTCCSSGCLNYACGNYFKLRLNGDYTLCCILNETNATDLYLDVVTSATGLTVRPNTSFYQVGGALNNFPPNTKRIYQYSKVGSKWLGRGWSSAESNSFDSINGSSQVYLFNSTGNCCCGASCFYCCACQNFNAGLGYVCFKDQCYGYGRHIREGISHLPHCGPQFINFCGSKYMHNAVLVKNAGKYHTIIAMVLNTCAGDSNLYAPSLFTLVHDLEGTCGKFCICSNLNQPCIAPYCFECTTSVNCIVGDTTIGSLKIISHSVSNDIILTYVPTCNCCGGYISVDRLSAVISGQQCRLQTICLCSGGGTPCYSCNTYMAPVIYHNLDNDKNIPASIWKVQCYEEVSGCTCITKFKFWKGTSACPVCHSCCTFRICDCTNFCRSQSSRHTNGCGIFRTDLCGKYMLLGGATDPCTIVHAYGMWMDSCWCSCTTTCISDIWCAQCCPTNNCGCNCAQIYVTTDEYLCHIIHFACSACECTYTFQNIWTRTGDSVVLSYNVCGSRCTNHIPARAPDYLFRRISVWENCIYGNTFWCATCGTCPCGAYGLKYCTTTCTWYRNTADLWDPVTAGYCGNYSLLGDTFNHLRDMANNNVDFFSIRVLSNTELCAVD